jgi:hypothetical protein
MTLSRYPHGISSFGIPVIGAGPIVTTGTVYFVDSATGSNSNSGLDPTQAFATLTTAITACTTNKGDVIILMPSHAETISTTVTLSIANVSIIGLGNGTARPNLTQGTTGSTGMLTVSGSNNRIANVYFTGSATGTNEPLLTISGSYVDVEGCFFAPASKQLYTILLSGTASTDISIKNCSFVASAAGPDAIIFSSVMVHRVIVSGCYFNVVGSAGCDHGIITVSSSASLGWLIKDCVFMGMADGEPAIKPLAASTGLVANCLAYTADVTDIILPSNILGTIDLLATEAAKAAQFTIKHPATTTTA